MQIDTSDDRGSLERLRSRLRLLYHGRSTPAVRFQAAVLVIDLLIIAFFIAAPILRDSQSFLWIDFTIAGILLADVVARALASTDTGRWLRQPATIVDLLILATLLLPGVLANFGFLRILRLWTLSQTGFLWRPLRHRRFAHFEEPARALVNLITSIFIATGFVYTFFVRQGTGIDGYVDALYFTVTSMTTTGYGDILLQGTLGRLVSIAIMIVGITLLVRVAQTLFRPNKVRFACPQCGLQRHDPDAVHCKACGQVLNIPDDGA